MRSDSLIERPKTQIRVLGVLVALLAMPSVSLAGVEEHDAWEKQFGGEEFTQAPVVHIRNVWGGVRVIESTNDTLSVSANVYRTAPDTAGLARSKEVFPVVFEQTSEGVSWVVGRRDRNGDYQWRCRGCKALVNFEVQAPKGTIIDIGSVMEGDVVVRGDFQVNHASNVNSGVSLANISACSDVSSVNGSIEIGLPGDVIPDCAIETINGDVSLLLRDDARGLISLSTKGGDVTSEHDLTVAPSKTEVVKQQSSTRNTYRITHAPVFRLTSGKSGDAITQIKTMNGDIRIGRLTDARRTK